MSSSTRVRIEDGIAWITLDDGKVNALSRAMIGEIEGARDQAESAGAVSVLRGREGIFSAGFDLPTFGRGLDASLGMVRAGARLIERLLAFPHPVLTVCTGHARINERALHALRAAANEELRSAAPGGGAEAA